MTAAGWAAVVMLSIGVVFGFWSQATYRSNREVSDVLLPAAWAFVVIGAVAAAVEWTLD